MSLDPSVANFARSTISSLVAGVLVLVFGAGGTAFHGFAKRLAHLQIELWHTQDAIGIKPVLPREL